MTAVSATCRSCGAAPQEGARFCDACGSPLTAPDVAEYKQVTVLFADVVRSMHIAAALEMERLHEVMTDLAGRSAAVARHFGGTAEFTGDGIMALFGAPAALEDHAFRACRAALDIQREADRLAADVARRDGIALRMRVGLNSGRVIVGAIGSGLGYAAIGETVGMAQRMQSIAPPGGVTVSESTARLVEHAAVLSDPELLPVKGTDRPVPVRHLLAISPRHARVGRAASRLVGRGRELLAVETMLDRAIGGRGAVVGVVGSPGIGKSRLVREVAAVAGGRGVDVVTAYCESQAREIPFHVVSRVLRAGAGVVNLTGTAARARVRARVPDADAQDLLLLDDLLGIADPEVTLPKIDPDARRRRLTALINTGSLARTTPALLIIEDAHWIDEVSESMLTDFLSVITRTPTLVMVTARPEYHGTLTRIAGAQTITLAPLSDSDMATLLAELVGSAPSVADLTAAISGRAAGNPFFAEEMVLEQVQRGVLAGERGAYACDADITEVSVPATVQATIEARIDRLTAPAKQTVHAAAVVGSRFGAHVLTALGVTPALDELVGAELIDEVSPGPDAEYAFHHPVIRAVAYESQLKAERGEVHRRVAAAIESAGPEAVDQNAAVIAEHLEAAGDLHAAYGWHMRAGTWSANRDLAAARVSWERARRIADALSPDDPHTVAMRIAPRTLLCGNGWRVDAEVAARFEELRELCARAGDKASLAVGMAGMVLDHMMHGRVRQGVRLASEQVALLDSIGDPLLTIGAGFAAVILEFHTGQISEVLRWSQRVIDWADGDATKGNVILGSPLAMALICRGISRYCLGVESWRDDLGDAVVMAGDADPATRALVVTWRHSFAVGGGVVLPDDATVRDLEQALRTAERSGDDKALGLAKYALAGVLLTRDTVPDRRRGLELMAQVRDMCLTQRFYRSELPAIDIYAERERARLGGRDDAIPLIRAAVDEVVGDGRLWYAVGGTALLVETLLSRGTEADLVETQRAIDRLAGIATEDGFVMRDIWLLRMRTQLARARGDDTTYRNLVSRYRAMAESLGFEGHMAVAAAM